MANLTDAQFQQLIQQIQGAGGGGGVKRKLATFASGDSTEWLQWRAGFANIRALNGWDEAASVAHIKAAMTGYAAMAVQGINHATAEGLLNLYEAKFCTAAASVQARQQFLASSQNEGESITAWHTRVKMLYRRSDAAANTETTKELIDKFIFGLVHEKVMERTLDARPANMTDALAEAANRAATLATIKEMHGKKPGVGLHSMNATHAPKPMPDRKCFNCDRTGHVARDCPQPKSADRISKAFEEFRNNKGKKGKGRRRGGGGGNNNNNNNNNNNSNSNGGQGQGGANPKMSVGALVEALGKMQIVDDDKEDSGSDGKGQGN